VCIIGAVTNMRAEKDALLQYVRHHCQVPTHSDFVEVGPDHLYKGKSVRRAKLFTGVMWEVSRKVCSQLSSSIMTGKPPRERSLKCNHAKSDRIAFGRQ